MISGWLQQKLQLGFEDWVLDGPPGPKMVGFCVLLGTPYAPVSKTPSVKAHAKGRGDRCSKYE